MGGLSSLFKPHISTVKEAEQMTLRWLAVGIVTMAVGFFMSVATDSTLGIIVLVLGSVVSVGTVLWVMHASKVSSVVRLCPRCKHPNHVLEGESYFRCSACGNFSVSSGF